MRQIALDTETTGIGHEFGHRVIEIGCVELVNRQLTGRTFHTYLNPKRDVDPGAFKVHGISDQFLKDKPEFKAIHPEFMQFIDNAELIIHNAVFDLGFLNAELKHMNHSNQIEDQCSVIDTLVMARKKYPGQRNSLDALCKRYDVDNTNRQLHGALLDAQILAQVYLAMTGGQTDLFGDVEMTESDVQTTQVAESQLSSQSPIYYANADELSRHQAFMQQFNK
ncbi:MAG: DNA polymerase III subunit epsilon [Legionella sp.]|nr:MAG: DNA polymerase III subunit epsilon [Legionella sp.]